MGLPTGSGPSPGPSPAPSPGPSPAPSLGPSPAPPSPSPPTPGDSGLSLGPPDASTFALGAALDEPILTDIDTGADQLLSTAVPDELSDPYSSAQGGWIVGPQNVDPYSNMNAASGALSFFVGRDVDPYSGGASDAGNPNAFTATQDVEPFSGVQNAEASTGGVGTPSLILNFDIGTVDVNGSANNVGGDQAAWTGFVTDANGVVWDQFVHSDGSISYQPSGGGPIVFTTPIDIERPPPGTPPPPDFVPEPTQPTAAQPAPQVSPTPAPSPTPLPAPSTTSANPVPAAAAPVPQPTLPPDQPTQQSAPLAPTPQPPSSAGSGAVPFDPMADSPFAKLLLYGSDTPFLDFLTNDSHLQVAQNIAAGVAIGAATIATGGMLLEVAPGALTAASTAAESISASITAAAQSIAMNPLAAGAIGSGAVGVIAKSPELEEELVEGAETLGPELEEALPSTAERAATTFQDIVRQADRLLRSNPDLIMELGGSSKGAPISPNQLGAAIGQYAEGNPAFARALGGNALEAVVNAIIEDLPPGTGSFMQVSGPNRIDFIGTGDFAGYTFELTTEAGVASHALRAYMQEPGAMIFTYIPIIE